MLAYVGQNVSLVSNWTQHMPTSCNIAQHGVQTNATCCAQHVGTTCCVRLHGPLNLRTEKTPGGVKLTIPTAHAQFSFRKRWMLFRTSLLSFL